MQNTPISDDFGIDDLISRIVDVEIKYDIRTSDYGEIMFELKYRGSPRNHNHPPKFYYDGGKHAIFMKNEMTVLVCDHINPAVRKMLANIKKILIAELKDGDLIDEYMVDVTIRSGVEELAEDLIKWHGAVND